MTHALIGMLQYGWYVYARRGVDHECSDARGERLAGTLGGRYHTASQMPLMLMMERTILTASVFQVVAMKERDESIHSAESGDDQWRDALLRHNRTIPRGSATSVCSISHRLKPARAVAVSSRCLSPIPIGGDIVWSDVHWSSDYDGSLDELEHEQNFREEKA